MDCSSTPAHEKAMTDYPRVREHEGRARLSLTWEGRNNGHVSRIPLEILYSRVGSIPTPMTGMKRNVTSIIVDAEHCVSFTGANRYSNSKWLVTCRMLTTLYNYNGCRAEHRSDEEAKGRNTRVRLPPTPPHAL